MMTTTITREERERVAMLLNLASGDWRRLNEWPLENTIRSVQLCLNDIDRVAQALRDAAPQWREVTATEPAKDIDVLIREGDGHCEVGWVSRKGLWMTMGGRPVKPAPTHWMPLPAPPEVKPAPAPAPQAPAQPGASEAARIEALERTVAELALAVERLTEKG